ncbi:hypothetical protein CPB83DRAFT_909901 [Crepidotus variabilis]|uniref:Uncharacterized protein n=1 Tax=Crepidotus variabilis TaxID=179855 RepID=A0A9P6E873_9AGAR|nr:hypothetical protein CPB83DRAFT_909901 [Crepidotus variabilis]
MAVDIDDNNSVIQYSGSWGIYSSTSTYGGTQYGGSSHKTTSTGSSVTLNFQGTGVRIYCSVPGDDGTVLHSKVRISLDGNTVKDIDKDTHPVDFNDDKWYDSGTLSNGAHTVTATYTGSSSDAGFIFDRFNLDGTAVGGGSPPSPPPPATTTTTTPKTITSKGSTTIRSNPGTTIVTVSNGHTVTVTGNPVDLVSPTSSVNSISSSASGTSSSSSKTQSSSISGLQEKTITVQSISTAADGSISTQTSVIVNTAGAAESHSDFPIGAIIGIVVSGVLMILFLIVLLLFMRRRRKMKQIMRLTDEGLENAHSSRHRLTTVTPFPLPPQRSVSGHGHSDNSHVSGNPQLQLPNEKDEPGFDAASVVTTSSFNAHYPTAAEEKSNLFLDSSSNGHSTNSPVLPEIDTGPLHFLHYDPIAPPEPALSTGALPSRPPSSYISSDYPPAYQSLRHLSTPLPPTRLAPLRPVFAEGPS